VFDYLRDPDSKLLEIFEQLEADRGRIVPKIELDKLKPALDFFKEYQKKERENPGIFREGNVILGAPPKEYIPSDEELIVSELGKLIERVKSAHSSEELEKYTQQHGIDTLEIEFEEIGFYHMDVMGSGRIFYAFKKMSDL